MSSRRPSASPSVTPRTVARLCAERSLLARRAHARLRVVTVVEEGLRAALESDTYRAGQAGKSVEDVIGEHELSARQAAEKAVAELDGQRQLAAEIESWVGDPVDVLVRLSEHLDLLVCGSRGYGPVRAVLLGAVSRRIVTEARCPVAVVPRGRESRPRVADRRVAGDGARLTACAAELGEARPRRARHPWGSTPSCGWSSHRDRPDPPMNGPPTCILQTPPRWSTVHSSSRTRHASIACDGDGRRASGFWAADPATACDALASTRGALLRAGSPAGSVGAGSAAASLQ